LRFDYRSAAGEQRMRTTDPHRLASLGRRWYLVAYDLDRHDWRSFRVDQMGAPERAGTRFAPRRLPTSDAAEFVRAGLRQAPTSYDVDVTVLLSPEEVRGRVGRWATVEPMTDGRTR